MYMSSWDKLSLESYKEKCEKLEKEYKKYIITFSSLYDNDRQYTKKIKEQEDLIDTMSDQLVELKNTVKIKQTKISELKECLRKKDSENEHLKSKIINFTMVQNLRAQVQELQSENEHLKSKVVDCTMCQNLQVQVEELKNVNESLNSSVEELYKARELTKATLKERDEIISAQFHDTQDNSEKDLILSLQTQLKETAELVVRFSDENKVLKSKETELINLEKVYDVKASELLEKIEQMKS
ncbi:hypothetical protein Tco_0573765 [Tanacetum coccineum]